MTIKPIHAFGAVALAASVVGVLGQFNRSTPPPAPAPVSYTIFLPNPQLSPGDVLDVTKDQICVKGYSGDTRSVPESLKNKVYAEYGIASHKPKEYEIDHLISLELGGSNKEENLWPQSYLSSPWNAHVKDKLENHLHALVCSGRVDLKTAQQEISHDWIAAGAQ
jgi:hypothetical protein